MDGGIRSERLALQPHGAEPAGLAGSIELTFVFPRQGVFKFAIYSSPIKGVRHYLNDVLKNAPAVNPPEDVTIEFGPPCPPEVVRL